WGVRGSIPAPLTPEQVRSRIASVIQRVRPSDLESAHTRELFLASLPPSLFGTVGGNTTCLEVRTDEDGLIILDAGTGLRELGVSLEKSRDPTRDFPLLFTHFHWDHLQGIPFFGPAWVKGNRITFASPMPSLERVLRDQMRPPYFPVTMDAMGAELAFRRLEGESVRIGSAIVRWKRMNHPGGSYAYRIAENGKSVIFANDSEVTDREFQSREENRAFFERADLLILDSQYTLEESFSKFDYGHTAYTMAVNLAVEWKVKTLVLFHHEPRSDDRKIHGMARRARFHLGQLDAEPMSILTAQEGMEIAI
ncbi:MAG: MBL fold metallo-hydrolase, partial [Acidobacteria bacterium]|nr:MBL fold metallo-hydrolase [Acidobacteriota bacterium]